ncbi:hypothetical protein BGZ70_005643 [Mortierella alpina]|uniref:F-box domain-containing protein n=1 Tax=Mortierella alpina TaxID=64518 RepID=A0A9P6J8L8_MORAP|nr:hypothetical protein BGZ70_005643 [Mortierella alpina]
MEHESAAHTVFATPELVLLACGYLPAPDLARCSLVCKAWSRQFEPILWARFCPKQRDADSSTDTPVVIAGLMRNLPHIRTLDLSVVDRTALQALTSPFDLADQDQSMLCTNLRRLKFGHVKYAPPDSASISLHLTALLNHNRLLTQLDLSYVFLASNAVLAAIADLERLQHITITSFVGAGTCREALLMLKACLHLPELTELHFIDMDLNWDEVDKNKEKDMPDVETIIKEASIARFSVNPTAAKIKSLRLPSNRYGARNPLPFLLLKSDLLDLETCEIPWFPKDADPKEIEQVVCERCPNLRHLICPSLRGEREQDGKAVCAFIRGCSGLKSFTAAELFSDYDAESFDDDYSDLEPRHIISEVVSRHFNTLEVLDLRDCLQSSVRTNRTFLLNVTN